MQKIQITSYKKRSGTALDQCQPRVLEILSFSCLCFFSIGPLRPFQIALCINLKWFYSGTTEIKSDLVH